MTAGRKDDRAEGEEGIQPKDDKDHPGGRASRRWEHDAQGAAYSQAQTSENTSGAQRLVLRPDY